MDFRRVQVFDRDRKFLRRRIPTVPGEIAGVDKLAAVLHRQCGMGGLLQSWVLSALAVFRIALADGPSALSQHVAGHTPISHPQALAQVDVDRRVKAELEFLRGHRIGFRQVTREEARALPPNNLKFFSMLGKITLAGPPWDPGDFRLIEILSLHPNETPAGATTAWQHPDTVDLFTRAKAVGYRIFIDPTTSSTGTGATCDDTEKVILADPRVTYPSLAHEVQHAEFSHYEIPAFIHALQNGEKRLEELISDPKHSGYGADRLRQVAKFVERGYPSLSINEAMSIREQLIAELRNDGHPIDSFRCHNQPLYLARIIIADMTKRATAKPLDARQRRWYLAALVLRQVQADDEKLRMLIESELWDIHQKSPEECEAILKLLKSLREEGLGALLDMPLSPEMMKADYRDRLDGSLNKLEIGLRERRLASEPPSPPPNIIQRCLFKLGYLNWKIEMRLKRVFGRRITSAGSPPARSASGRSHP